jgi:alkylated DNA repair dioxygenase AlkB
MWFQGSLLDGLADDPGCDAPAAGDAAIVRPLADIRRHALTHGAWVDHAPGWLRGSDELFLRLQDAVPWRAERREMYDRVVDVPRLVCSYGVGDALPDASLVEARDALNEYYGDELGESFVTAGLCFYRDGRDSVAWHGDRIGRGRSENTMVAIVSLGAERRLSLRPRSGGQRIDFPVGHGDLLVMGGTCQRTWDHAVLKTAKAVGPRISVQFRPLNVL